MRELRLKLRWGVGTLSCMAVLGVAALSCGSPEDPPPPIEDVVPPSRVEITGGITPGELFTGQRTLQAIAEDDSGRLAKVAFFVSGFPACADPEARDSGVTFSCTWDTRGFEEGDYQLVATAQDDAGNTAASEPIAFKVGTRQEPVISAIAVNPPSVNEGQTVSLSVTASDAQGDPLTYAWSQVAPATPAGTFTNGTSANATWRAPRVPATRAFTLKVTVSDGNGGTAERTVDLQVVNVPGLNQPPVVSATITGPTTVLAGSFASLSVTASDPDGDPLTISWSTAPSNQGTFTSSTTATTNWRSGDIATATDFTVQITVSDGEDSVTRSKVVRATVPTYSANIQTIWTSKCTSCHDSSSPDGGLNLLSGVSRGNLVGQQSTNTCGLTPRPVRVVAGQPDRSVLVWKIGGTPSTTCGSTEPQNDLGYFGMNPGMVTRIRSWILAGALNN
jgi:hypothetical protein